MKLAETKESLSHVNFKNGTNIIALQEGKMNLSEAILLTINQKKVAKSLIAQRRC